MDQRVIWFYKDKAILLFVMTICYNSTKIFDSSQMVVAEMEWKCISGLEFSVLSTLHFSIAIKIKLKKKIKTCF